MVKMIPGIAMASAVASLMALSSAEAGVIYRWQVTPGQEEAFVAAWIQGTRVIRGQIKAAQGSVLLRNRGNPSEFIAIAQWDNFEAWGGVLGSSQQD